MTEHLARLGGRSRPTGSASADDARAYCAGVLRGLGFAVTEHSFTYSKFSGAWATPLAGLLVPAVATAAYVARGTSPAWIVGAATLLAVSGIYFGGPGVVDFPFLRRRGVNLEATRVGEADEPIVWLVAHIDSKWQPVSMIVRVFGVVVTAIAIGGILVSLLIGPAAAPAFLVAAWIGGIPLMLSIVGDRNTGALDNASGVATVLEAAAMIPAGNRVGVLITDAEELALAGARVWSLTRKPVVALNVDTIDDEGPLVVMYGRSGSVGPVISRFRRAAEQAGERLLAFRLIPGILTDSVALAEAGWLTVTLSRGTVRTLGRVHTSRDTLHSMDGRGIAGAARVVASVAARLTGD